MYMPEFLLQNLFKSHSNRNQTVLSDKDLVKICLEEVSRKSGYAHSKTLRQRDFEFLSGEIEKSTGILISISTIKRLLNGQFNHLPQAATLNAITSYLGYGSWQAFRKVNQQESRLSAANGTALREQRKAWFSYRIFIPVIAGILFVLTASLNYLLKHETIKEKDVSFSVKKTTGNDIPNTVVFTYDVAAVNGDSFFIQQSWDRDRRVKIEKNKHTLTDIYYEPGYHNAKLIVNDEVVKTIDVNIPTNGWFFFSKPGLFKGLPSRIIPKRPVRNGVLSLTPDDVIGSKINPALNNFYYYTLFPEKCEVESDNFIFKARIRIKAINNIACPIIIPEICEQSNSLYFFTTLPGCTSNTAVNVGEHLLSGKTTDLSAFGVDIYQWQDIEVIVKNKTAQIFIGSREIFSSAYAKSAGLITGLAFMSNGLCEIDSISLKGFDGRVVYENDFEQNGVQAIAGTN